MAKGVKPIDAESMTHEVGSNFMAMLEESAPRIAAGTAHPITSDDISEAIADARP